MEKNELQLQDERKDMPIGSFYTSMTNFENGQRVSKMLSSSTMIPREYQNNIPNCMLALEVASRAKMSPFMVMQNLDIIHGKPSWSSKFIIAMINGCGLYTRLRFKLSGEGMNMSCYATCKEIEADEILIGSKVTMQMAKKEGWLDKKGSKWQTMPELMIKYRAAAFFAREHCPELLMGLYTVDENQNIPSSDPLDNIPDAEDLEFVVEEENFSEFETDDFSGTPFGNDAPPIPSEQPIQQTTQSSVQDEVINQQPAQQQPVQQQPIETEQLNLFEQKAQQVQQQNNTSDVLQGMSDVPNF